MANAVLFERRRSPRHRLRVFVLLVGDQLLGLVVRNHPDRVIVQS